MSRGLLSGLKDIVLLFDEIKRLSANIQKLNDRVEAIERRIAQAETERAVGAVRDEALVIKVEAATRIAVAEMSARLSDRVTRLEIGLVSGGGLSHPPETPD